MKRSDKVYDNSRILRKQSTISRDEISTVGCSTQKTMKFTRESNQNNNVHE